MQGTNFPHPPTRHQQQPLPPPRSVSSTTGSSTRTSVSPPHSSSTGTDAGGNGQGSSLITQQHQILLQKEMEFKLAVESNQRALENLAQNRAQEIETLRAHLHGLQLNYKHNFDLIEQRDAELQRAYQRITELEEERDQLEATVKDLGSTGKAAETQMEKLRQQLQRTTVELEGHVATERRRNQELSTQHAAALRSKEAAHAAAIQELMGEAHQRAEGDNVERKRFQAHLESQHKAAEDAWKQTELGLRKELKELLSTAENRIHMAEGLQKDLQAARVAHSEVLELAEKEGRRCALLQAEVDELREAQQLYLRSTVTDTSAKDREAETAIWEATKKMREAEAEVARITAENSTLEQRCHWLMETRDGDAKRLAATAEDIRRRYHEDLTRKEEAMYRLEETVRQLNNQTESSARIHEELNRELFRLRSELKASEDITTEKGRQINDLALTITSLKDKLDRAETMTTEQAEGARQQNTAFADKEREWRRKIDDLQTKNHSLQQERNQATQNQELECGRLRRELQTSEALRWQLQAQLDERREPEELTKHTIEELGNERRRLQTRVRDLEDTNARIRSEVARITSEMENPAILAAKENAERVIQLTKQLEESRSSCQKAEAAVREKEVQIVQLHADAARGRPGEEALSALVQDNRRLRAQLDDFHRAAAQPLAMASTYRGEEEGALAAAAAEDHRQVELQRALRKCHLLDVQLLAAMKERDAQARKAKEFENQVQSLKQHQEELRRTMGAMAAERYDLRETFLKFKIDLPEPLQWGRPHTGTSHPSASSALETAAEEELQQMKKTSAAILSDNEMLRQKVAHFRAVAGAQARYGASDEDRPRREAAGQPTPMNRGNAHKRQPSPATGGQHQRAAARTYSPAADPQSRGPGLAVRGRQAWVAAQ